MNQKQVYCFDADGRFSGVTVADESPLEPGVFLFPAGTTDLAPSEEKAGFHQVFKGGEWVFCQTPPVPTLTPVNEEKTLLTEQDAATLLALAESDRVLLRCYENGMAAPSEWVQYRKELRKMLSAQVLSDFPQKPAFPKGT